MAILTRTAGQTLSLSEVRAFFDGKFDPAVAGVDGSSLSHYLRGRGIVPSVSQGAGFTDFYTGMPHARFGRGFNGADGTTNSAEHTWGIYSNTVDLTTNPIGIDPESTALTEGSEYRLVFNIRDEDGNDISADYLAFLSGDRLRFERNTGTFAGNGYVFELTNDAVSNNDDGQGDNPVVVTMGARVIEILGTGLIDDQLSTSPDRDTLTASRSAGGITYPATGGIALDNLGSVQKATTPATSWPSEAADLMGAVSDPSWDNDLDYAPGTTTEAGSIVNDTGETFTIFNITCAVTFTNLRGNASINPFFWVRRNNGNVGFPNPTITSTGQQIYTISSNTGFTWNVANGTNLNFQLNSGQAFDYTVDYLRINLASNEEFAPTGTGGGGGGMDINVDVPETSPLMLSQLRNVDDGLPEEEQQQQQQSSAQSNPPPGGSTDDTDLSPTTGPNGET